MRRLIPFILLILSVAVPVKAKPPQRIISLAPSLTEILYAIGLGDRIIAVTDFCDWPPEAREKPRVGGMINPSLEAILSMKPDIIVMAADGNPLELKERLASLGMNTHVLGAKRLAELPPAIRALGKTLGVDKEAEALALDIEEKFAGLRRNVRHGAGEKAIFIVWPEPLIVAGPDTPIHDAFNLLGLENIAAAAPSDYPKYSIEDVIVRSPSVIFIGKGHADMERFSERLLKRLSGVDAVKNHRVYYVSDSILRLGPRIVEGIDELKEFLEE